MFAISLCAKENTKDHGLFNFCSNWKGVNANALESVHGINNSNLDALLEKMMAVFKDQIDAAHTEQPPNDVAETE